MRPACRRARPTRSATLKPSAATCVPPPPHPRRPAAFVYQQPLPGYANTCKFRPDSYNGMGCNDQFDGADPTSNSDVRRGAGCPLVALPAAFPRLPADPLPTALLLLLQFHTLGDPAMMQKCGFLNVGEIINNGGVSGGVCTEGCVPKGLGGLPPHPPTPPSSPPAHPPMHADFAWGV